MPAGEATAVVNNPVCVPRILAGCTSNDRIYQKRTSFIANVTAELIPISAFRNYATLGNRSKKCRLGRLKRQHMNFIQCTKVDKTENVNPNAKYIMRCTGCISPTALKSTQITSWQA